MSKITNNFFSVSFDLIPVNQNMPYDLYVNSSTSDIKEKFVRIHPLGDTLTIEDLKIFKKKYFQLYVNESQRAYYLRGLITCLGISHREKVEIIKDFAIHYLDQLFDKYREFNTEALSETLHGCKAIVESMIHVLKGHDVSRIRKLIGTLSYHDFYTYDHSINVSMYCIALYSATHADATNEELVIAGLGGLLHDIGKLNISTQILNNPNKLSDVEFEVIKTHPVLGYELLNKNQCNCPGFNLDIIKKIVYEHHENFNGSGYPNKLAGVDIHFYSRLTAIADFFDAITTKRSYHEVLSTEEAIEVMSKSVGRKLDPELFAVFKASIRQLEFSGMIHRELPDDFDPCQPQDILPFVTPRPGYKVEGFGNMPKNQFIKKTKKAG